MLLYTVPLYGPDGGMADAGDLKSLGFYREGSSPSPGTKSDEAMFSSFLLDK